MSKFFFTFLGFFSFIFSTILANHHHQNTHNFCDNSVPQIQLQLAQLQGLLSENNEVFTNLTVELVATFYLLYASIAIPVPSLHDLILSGEQEIIRIFDNKLKDNPKLNKFSTLVDAWKDAKRNYVKNRTQPNYDKAIEAALTLSYAFNDTYGVIPDFRRFTDSILTTVNNFFNIQPDFQPLEVLSNGLFAAQQIALSTE